MFPEGENTGRQSAFTLALLEAQELIGMIRAQANSRRP